MTQTEFMAVFELVSALRDEAIRQEAHEPFTSTKTIYPRDVLNLYEVLEMLVTPREFVENPRRIASGNNETKQNETTNK